MKSLFKSVSFLFVLCLSTLIPIVLIAQDQKQPDPERIAVLNLLNQAQLKPQEVEYLTNLIRQSFAEKANAKYLLMTQENIMLLLPPDKKIEDCLQECEVETGRVLGAKYIITGSILIFSETYRLNIKVHNTENGSLITSKVLKGKNLEELENSIQQGSFELFNQIDHKNQNESEKRIVAGVSQKEELKPQKEELKPQKEELKPQTSKPSDQDISMEDQIKKSLGFGLFLGTGIGVEYADLGAQFGIQYQFSYLNIKFALGSNSTDIASSLKLFLGRPSKHQFGVGISGYSQSDWIASTSNYPLTSTSSSDTSLTENFEETQYISTSILYIFDVGQLNGFQLHAGFGFLQTSIERINESTTSSGVDGSAGIHYLF